MDQRITVKDIAIIAAVVNADDGKTPHWGKLGIAGGNTRSSGVQDDHGLYLKEIEGGKADTLIGQTHKWVDDSLHQSVVHYLDYPFACQ